MQTQELHIELDILLQKVNSHYNQNLLPQEKDLFINREIIRFINRRISRLSNRRQEGLFDTIKRTVELSPLLKTKRLPVMYSKDKKEAVVLLPFDFLYYVSSELSCCCPCLGNVVYSTFYYTYDLNLSQLSYENFKIELTQGLFTSKVSDADIPDDYYIEDDVPYYSNQIMFTNALIQRFHQVNDSSVEIVFDKVHNVLTFRSLVPFSAKINGNEVQVVPVECNKLEDIANPLFSTIEPIDEEFKGHIKRSYLSGAKDEKTLASIRATELILTMNSVIGDYVELTYLKKPNKIDLLLQCNSELSDETLSEIIADTAQRVMGVIGNDTYAKYAQENILIE